MSGADFCITPGDQPQALPPPPGLFPGAEWQALDKAAPRFEGPQKRLARVHQLRWRHAHAFLAPPAPATCGVKAGGDSEEFASALGADQRATLKSINHPGDFGEDHPGGTERLARPRKHHGPPSIGDAARISGTFVLALSGHGCFLHCAAPSGDWLRW